MDYKQLSKEQLIELLKEKEKKVEEEKKVLSELKNTIKSQAELIKKRDQEISNKKSKIKKLKKDLVQANNKALIIQNNLTNAIRNALEDVKDRGIEGINYIKSLFEIEPESFAADIGKLSRFIQLICIELIDNHFRLMRYSPIMDQDKSESNKRKNMNRESNLTQKVSGQF